MRRTPSAGPWPAPSVSRELTLSASQELRATLSASQELRAISCNYRTGAPVAVPTQPGIGEELMRCGDRESRTRWQRRASKELRVVDLGRPRQVTLAVGVTHRRLTDRRLARQGSPFWRRIL